MSTDGCDWGGVGGSTHILLEVSQTPEVFPPRCPHSGPGLDLRGETLLSEAQAETHPQALVNGDRMKKCSKDPSRERNCPNHQSYLDYSIQVCFKILQPLLVSLPLSIAPPMSLPSKEETLAGLLELQRPVGTALFQAL